MEGAARAAKRKSDAAISAAWHTAAFSGAAQAGKLKKLDTYLPREKTRPQSGSEMLAIMRDFAARGAKMNIRQVN